MFLLAVILIRKLFSVFLNFHFFVFFNLCKIFLFSEILKQKKKSFLLKKILVIKNFIARDPSRGFFLKNQNHKAASKLQKNLILFEKIRKSFIEH
jgi:hypothetical protein